jgi:hypothetical protein
MAGMTPDEFFHGFVLENYEDWKDAPHSIRRAFNVSVSAFHLADHYFRYYKRRDQEFAAQFKELGDFQAALTARTPSFKIIQDMANAYKHLYTRASCSIASGGSIESLSYDGQTIEEDWREDGTAFAGFIVIRRRDKSVVEFAPAIDAVVEIWSGIVLGDDRPALWAPASAGA